MTKFYEVKVGSESKKKKNTKLKFAPGKDRKME